MNYIIIKKNSRQINKNHYGNALILICISLITTLLFCIIPFLIKKIFILNTALYIPIFILLTVMFFMLHSVFSVGEIAWYTGRSVNKKKTFTRFVFWLRPKYALKAIGIKTVLRIIKSIITLFLISPGMLAIFFAVTLAFTGGIEVNVFMALLGGGIIMAVIGLIFSYIINQRFFLTDYLLTENPGLGIIQVIKQSKNLTEGQLFDIIKFKLSFVPIFLLSVLLFPLIYIYPYYKQSCCIIAKKLRI